MKVFYGRLNPSLLIFILFLFSLCISHDIAIAQETLPETQVVFGKYSDRVVKIQVVEKGSGAKAVIGSAFFVSAEGHIVTNYHVIAKLVLQPDRYRAELLEISGAQADLQVLGVDVINDLAVVKAAMKNVPYFRISSADLRQGTRLYSLGFPLDIGLSIVEGTYNGLLKHALYKKIHFTAPLNPGMSGGPAISASGDVVGVNVSSAGEQVSFLVPAEAVEKLLSSTLRSAAKEQKEFIEIVRTQLLTHQDVYFTDSLMRSGKHITLGGYSLPTELTPFFKCWGDAEHVEKLPYHWVEHHCSTDDYVHISGEHHSGIIRFSHQLITSDEMNKFRFYDLYSDFFKKSSRMFGNEEEVTRFKCKSDTIRQGPVTFKTAFCMRGYRKLKGLYDVVFKAATLGSKNSGLQTTLELSGVSFEKAVSLTRGYLGEITWEK